MKVLAHSENSRLVCLDGKAEAGDVFEVEDKSVQVRILSGGYFPIGKVIWLNGRRPRLEGRELGRDDRHA